MELSLEKINSYMKLNKTLNTYKIHYTDFEVTVKNRLTIEEQQQFVEQVVANAYINNLTFSKPALDAAFDVMFVKMCTDIPIPMKVVDKTEYVDTQMVCDIVHSLKLYEKVSAFANDGGGDDIYYTLKNIISSRISFENSKRIAVFAQSNATAEAIDTLNVVLNAGLDLINKVQDILEKNGNKITKALTPKRINEFINNIQKKYIESLKPTEEKEVIAFDPLQSK